MTRRWSTAPGASGTVVAVDARGDSAVAWTTCGGPHCERTAHSTGAYVTLRLVGGRLVTRRLSANGFPLAVVIGRGEVTVVWSSPPGKGMSGAILRASYGSLLGRWRAQTMGRWDIPPGYSSSVAKAHLAVARGGEVLLAWDDYAPPIDGSAVAWRVPGHGFTAPRRLSRSSLAPNGLGPVAAFDAGGSAYISGPCSGFVFLAPPHRHRFEPPIDVAPGRVQPSWMRHSSLDFNLSLAGAGEGLASWVRGECSSGAEGSTPGPVFASVLRAGRFGEPLLLASGGAYNSTAVAVGEGGGTVSWTEPPGGFTLPLGGLFSVAIGADGSPGPVARITNRLVPFARGGGGDQVLGASAGFLPGAGDESVQTQGEVLVVRPVGGGADAPSPSRYGWLATSTPVGRAIALVWDSAGNGKTLALSVWRP